MKRHIASFHDNSTTTPNQKGIYGIIVFKEDLEVRLMADEKAKTAALNDKGIGTVEKILGVENLYDPKNIEILHCVQQALKAHALFKNEVTHPQAHASYSCTH